MSAPKISQAAETTLRCTGALGWVYGRDQFARELQDAGLLTTPDVQGRCRLTDAGRQLFAELRAQDAKRRS